MSEIVVEKEAAHAEPTPPLNDCSPERQVELRYLNALDPLLADAVEHRSGQTLVNVLTWTLARIAVAHGSVWIGGDIVRRLGDHMCTLSERRRSEEESEQSKEESHPPH
jgi:hypothetical protein